MAGRPLAGGGCLCRQCRREAQAEFACGRHFDRRCFRALGRPDGPLPANPDRSPRWPDGLIGSITHTDTYCAAAVARADDIAGIGIDVEDLSRFQPELLRYVLSPGDTTRNSRGLRSGVDNCLGAALFSAKETLYKCLNGLQAGSVRFRRCRNRVRRWFGSLLRPVTPAGRSFYHGTRIHRALPHRGRAGGDGNDPATGWGRYPVARTPGPTSRPAQVGDISFERLSQRDSDNLSARSEQRRLCDDRRYVPAVASSASVNEVKGGMDAQH